LLVKPKYVGSDVEGIIGNPGSDFAWQVCDQLLSKETKNKFPRGKCEDYDNKYDDGRYFHDLGRSTRHATGMWPALSLALAAYDGKTDDDLIEFAEKTTQPNPGADKLVSYWLDNFEEVYFITSSYPPVALKFAKRYDIPFTNVFTLGKQLPLKIRNNDFETEVKNRSPLSILSKNRKELGRFLDEYVRNCEILGDFYSGATNHDAKTVAELAIRNVLGEQREIFERVSDSELKRELEYLFLTEEGIMGSHGKVNAMRRVFDDRRFWTYVGDGIVDAMPIDYAVCGFSLNMKDKHALSLSKMNFATTDLSELIPVYEAMFRGEFGPSLKELDSEKIRVFTPDDIQEDIEAVVKANGEAKSKLKALYVPVKV